MGIIIKKKPAAGPAVKLVKPLPGHTPEPGSAAVDEPKPAAAQLGASAKLMKAAVPKAEAAKAASAPVAAQYHPVVENTSVKHPDGSEANATKIIGGEMFEAPPANVSVTLGFTKNMGNYNSVKFSVSLTVPCANTEKDIAQSYAFAKEWTDQRAEEVQNELAHH